MATRLKHGHNRRGLMSPTYQSWSAMGARCHRHPDYISRGIVVCPHWLSNFEGFLSDMKERPEGTTLERANNDLGYLCPVCLPPRGNCYWASWKQQARNRRTTKLDQEKVAAIRSMVGTQRVIAKLFGMDRSDVSRIKSGKRWA